MASQAYGLEINSLYLVEFRLYFVRLEIGGREESGLFEINLK